MPSVGDFTDPYIEIYRTVPLVADGVCDVCHKAPNPGWQRCWSCDNTMRQVWRPLSLVIPISLYRVGEQLHHVLRNYKDGPKGPARSRHRLQVAATLARFLTTHRPCIIEAAGDVDWQHLTTVPSSSGRPGLHPFQEILNLVPAMGQAHLETLAPGPTSMDHNRPSDQGYAPMRDVAGMRLLLLDDTFTSGARLQSAASILQLAGATVVAAVVVGRVIDPNFNEANRILWETVSRTRFSFETCCLTPHD